MPAFDTTLGNDPFSLVNQAIWDGLNAYAPFAALVRAGNQINEVPSGPLAAKPAAITAGATPEVRLIQNGVVDVVQNSMAVRLIQQFQLLLTTYSINVTPINQLVFVTLIALNKMSPTLNLPFVQDWQVQYPSGQKHVDSETGASGVWIVVAQFTVRMTLNNSDITAL